jgi:hypothetical protein
VNRTLAGTAGVVAAVLVFVQAPRASADVVDTMSPAFRLSADSIVGTHGSFVTSWLDSVLSLTLVPTSPTYSYGAAELRPTLEVGTFGNTLHQAVRFTQDATHYTRLRYTGAATGSVVGATNTVVVVYSTPSLEQDANFVKMHQANDAWTPWRVAGIGRLGVYYGAPIPPTPGPYGMLASSQTNGGGGGSWLNTAYAPPVGGVELAEYLFTASSETIWADGVLQATGGGGASPAGSANYQITVGGDEFWTIRPDGFFNGDIAELLIFTRALTADERLALNAYVDRTYRYRAAIPEPASLSLLAVLGAVLLRRGARR